MMDQSKPPPGWRWVRTPGSRYVEREGGGVAMQLLQAWNIWLTEELDKARERIADLEESIEAAAEQIAGDDW